MNTEETHEEMPTDALEGIPQAVESAEEQAARERDDFKEIAARAQAELINYRRRIAEERRSIEQNAANGLITRLLPVTDDLDRAVSSMPEDLGAWGDGVQMVAQNLRNVIQAVGVEQIVPVAGATFDPAIHEAIYYQPTGDHLPGTVVQCVRAGYRSPDRVLRAAQVVVAGAPEKPADLATETKNSES